MIFVRLFQRAAVRVDSDANPLYVSVFTLNPFISFVLLPEVIESIIGCVFKR
jgi:hypothetical protein